MNSPAFSIVGHLLPIQNGTRAPPNMAICLTLAIFLTSFIFVLSDESPSDVDDSSSMLASGKRQHNIMRFGKRPSGGHSLMHFGKREDPRHRFLFMGKRGEDSSGLLHFLQGEDNSYKRGHTIMRFGKRKVPPQETHNFMRFGRGGGDDQRSGHAMMYFGKRPDGHSMMYFGKRENDDDPGLYLDPDSLSEEGKRVAHAMIHFGKREEDEDSKRASHSMIHFGKRFEDDESDETQYPLYQEEFDPSDKRNHNLLRFGKKTEGSRVRGTHAMIHFGKRSLTGNQSEVVTRTKRDIDEDEDEIPSALVWDENPGYIEYNTEPEKRDASKNVFLRFG